MPTLLEVGAQVRCLLAGLQTNAERRDALAMAAVCPECGASHAAFYDRRGFFSCDCGQLKMPDNEGAD